MPIFPLITLGALVLVIVIFLIDRHHTQRCPVCESSKMKEMDRTTEKIELDKREIPGIGSKVHVSAIVSFRCYSCGHAWQKREQN